MCGVFGWVAQGESRPDLGRLRAIALVAERRGDHAFGFAWVDGRGRLATFKQAGPISQSLDRLEMLADARVLIGHCRWATHGLPEANKNNHPHPAGKGWIVHNGVFGGYREVARRFRLKLKTECDSEVIGGVIGVAGGDMLSRAILAVKAGGYGPLVVLGLWRPGRLVVVVQGGQPLHASADRKGTYLGSLEPGLPRGAVQFPDDQAWEFSRNGLLGRRPFQHPLKGGSSQKVWGRWQSYRDFAEVADGWEDGD